MSHFNFEAAMEAIGHHDGCDRDEADAPGDVLGTFEGWCHRARRESLQRLEATLIPDEPTLIPESEAIDLLWREIRHLRGYAGTLLRIQRLAEAAHASAAASTDATPAAVTTQELKPLLDLVDPGVALTEEDAAFIANELRARDYDYPQSAVKDQRRELLQLLYGKPVTAHNLTGD